MTDRALIARLSNGTGRQKKAASARPEVKALENMVHEYEARELDLDYNALENVIRQQAMVINNIYGNSAREETLALMKRFRQKRDMHMIEYAQPAGANAIGYNAPPEQLAIAHQKDYPLVQKRQQEDYPVAQLNAPSGFAKRQLNDARLALASDPIPLPDYMLAPPPRPTPFQGSTYIDTMRKEAGQKALEQMRARQATSSKAPSKKMTEAIEYQGEGSSQQVVEFDPGLPPVDKKREAEEIEGGGGRRKKRRPMKPEAPNKPLPPVPVNLVPPPSPKRLATPKPQRRGRVKVEPEDVPRNTFDIGNTGMVGDVFKRQRAPEQQVPEQQALVQFEQGQEQPLVQFEQEQEQPLVKFEQEEEQPLVQFEQQQQQQQQQQQIPVFWQQQPLAPVKQQQTKNVEVFNKMRKGKEPAVDVPGPSSKGSSGGGGGYSGEALAKIEDVDDDDEMEWSEEDEYQPEPSIKEHVMIDAPVSRPPVSRPPVGRPPQPAQPPPAGGGAGNMQPPNVPEGNGVGDEDQKYNKEMAAQFNAERQAMYDQAAANPQSMPDLNKRVQVPREIRRATALPQVTNTYHGPYDRGTLQPYTNLAEMGYQGVGGLHVYTGMTAAQVNRTNAKRKRQGYILYDDVAKEWTHIKKKDIPTRGGQLTPVIEQAIKKRKISEDAGGPLTGWEHDMRAEKSFQQSRSAMDHANTQQPGDLQPKRR